MFIPVLHVFSSWTFLASWRSLRHFTFPRMDGLCICLCSTLYLGNIIMSLCHKNTPKMHVSKSFKERGKSTKYKVHACEWRCNGLSYALAKFLVSNAINCESQGRIQDLRKGGSYTVLLVRAKRRNFCDHAPFKVPRPLINPHVLPHDL